MVETKRCGDNPACPTRQLLQSLVRDGLVVRRVEPTVPPRVHYSLTPLGRTLDEPLAALRDWAQRHMATIDAHRSGHG